MRIGFIGAANLAQTYAKHLLRIGHSVIMSNRRGPDTLASLVESLGPRALAASVEVAAEADIVVLALPLTQLRSLQQRDIDWNGRIVVDATAPANRTTGKPPCQPVPTYGLTTLAVRFKDF